MLAEGIAREKFEMEVRDKAQEKVRYSQVVFRGEGDLELLTSYNTPVS